MLVIILLSVVGFVLGGAVGASAFFGSVVFTVCFTIMVMYYLRAVYVLVPSIMHDLTYHAKHKRPNWLIG